jgi:hypothetical protein
MGCENTSFLFQAEKKQEQYAIIIIKYGGDGTAVSKNEN